MNTRDDPYLLDATAALSVVRERLEKAPARVRRQSHEAMVLRRLLLEARELDKRREPRRSDSRWVSLLPGVYDIHQDLALAANKGPGSQGTAGRRVLDSPVFDRFEFSAE